MFKYLPVSDEEFLFGVPPDRLKSFMPESIPEEFRNPLNKWNRLFNAWFFYGLVNPVFKPKPVVGGTQALRHIHAIMSSDLLDQLDKEAACAYLLHDWFEVVTADNLSEPVVNEDAGGDDA